eukprot:5277415-Alexandrium_andersonii.AAC.1
MSASLVGSEMCIRDRATGDPCRSPNGRLAVGGYGRGGGRRRWHGALPVSYTHLTLPTICSV